MGMVEEALGEAVGELYVGKYFSGDAKARALAVVEQVSRKGARSRVDKTLEKPRLEYSSPWPSSYHPITLSP